MRPRSWLTALVVAAALPLVAAQAQSTAYLRPALHFTPARNFMNDPNGLVYYQGEYHLFYQYNPFGQVWGHMSWAHAVSRDLLTWTHLPVALREADGIMIFSGSAVVDRHNTSGFCTARQGDSSCLVAIYTGHGLGKQTQNLAYSNDRGRTWTRYRGNPVIDLGLENFRDPKVIWHEPTRRWVMVTVLADQHKVRLFGSRDLTHWETLSDFGPAAATGGVWECPDLFELPVEGEPGKTRWVLDVDINPGGYAGGSGGQYFVGDFDGTRFVNDNPDSLTLWVDYGKDFYATTSYSDIPASDGRRIWIGWISNWEYANEEPTVAWRGGQSMPREVTLRRTPDGLRLVQRPVRELAARRSRTALTIAGPTRLPGAAEFSLQVPRGTWREAGLRLFNARGEAVTLGVTSEPLAVFVDRSRARVGETSGKYGGRHGGAIRWPGDTLTLRVLYDRSVVEIFVNDGEQVVTERFYPTAPLTSVAPLGDVPGMVVTMRELR
ncbi:MAG: glycoside hydrolase family 32 protein [Gemmatimonadales bacterium]